MKIKSNIIVLLLSLPLCFCTGSRKYFKAAEKLEKQGLVGDAAEYYLESLQRKPTNVEARIKLKEVGQKHVSSMASEFFRNFNTQQLDASLASYEKLKEFYNYSAALDVGFDYPKTYDEDYNKVVEDYCSQHYNRAHELVMQKNYSEALLYLNKVQKYKSSYKNSAQLNIIATCEPLYQGAVNFIESKNYNSALRNLEAIKAKTDNYKDSRDLLELASAQETRSFILFKPSSVTDNASRETTDRLYTTFGQLALQRNSALKIINNSPFQETNAFATEGGMGSQVDLIQAIRKATGADYFFFFEISNRREFNPAFTKTAYRGYIQVQTRKNDTLVITEYRPFDYNIVKGQRSFTYDFKYKIINTATRQVVAQQTQSMRGYDALEYQEFLGPFDGNVNSLFPYNPQQTSAAGQYNPRQWRSLFSARNTLRPMEELKNEAYKQNQSSFLNALNNMK